MLVDDSFLKTLSGKIPKITFGSNSGDWRLWHTKNAVSIERRNSIHELKNEHIMGEHNFSNLSASFLMAISICPKQEKQIRNAAETFRPTENRSSWKSIKNKKIFLDAYNANPSSMSTALQSFVKYISLEKIKLDEVLFILGDMNELGEHAEKLHSEVGMLLKKLGASRVVFIGRYSQFYREGFGDGCRCYAVKQEYEKDWQNDFDGAGYFFIKGSRSLQLESLIAIT